jgi:hypothetical protein
MKKHYKSSNLDEGGYVVPKGLTNLTKDYREHKLAQGVVLMPANLSTASRNTLIRIIRDQARLIAELRIKG